MISSIVRRGMDLSVQRDTLPWERLARKMVIFTTFFLTFAEIVIQKKSVLLTRIEQGYI